VNKDIHMVNFGPASGFGQLMGLGTEISKGSGTCLPRNWATHAGSRAVFQKQQTRLLLLIDGTYMYISFLCL